MSQRQKAISAKACDGKLFASTMLINMEQQSFNPDTPLNIIASNNSSPKEFDFFIGKWNITIES
jgi:hypothetical protein